MFICLTNMSLLLSLFSRYVNLRVPGAMHGRGIRMGGSIFKDEISRREAMKTAMKAGAYAAPVIIAVSLPGAAGAQVMISTANTRPTITGITPSSGSTAGGTVVTLTGTNFCAGATVAVNGVAGTGVTVVNATTITFTTPPGTLGAVTVTVTCPNGTGTTTFTYTAPAAGGVTVTGVTPGVGPTTGGTPITITGTGFAPGSTVTIGGAPATGVTVTSPTTITATTPPGTAGGQPVTVTNPGGTGTGTFTFRTVTPAAEAYAATASALALVNLNRVNDQTLPPGSTNTVATVTAAGVLSTGVATDSAQNISNTTPGFVTAQATSTIANVNLLSGAVTATAITAQATSTSNGSTASSTPAFTGVVVIGAASFNLATVGLNAMVNIPGVANVTLNRVVTTTTGANSSLTATAVYVQLLSVLLTGVTVEIATAISGVTTT